MLHQTDYIVLFRLAIWLHVLVYFSSFIAHNITG